MKTLRNSKEVDEIRSRLLALTADDQPKWGIMNVTQMVCHLREPYLFALSPAPVVPIRLPIPAKVAKYVALSTRLPWPKDLPTVPEFRVGGASMATCTFASDHAGLLEAFNLFSSAPSITRDHPFFTTMSHADWLRWGYLHADHHLRQFGR